MTAAPWHFLPALRRSFPRSHRGDGTAEWHFSICMGMIDGPIRYQRHTVSFHVLIKGEHPVPDVFPRVPSFYNPKVSWRKTFFCEIFCMASFFVAFFWWHFCCGIFPSGNLQPWWLHMCCFRSCTSSGWKGWQWHKELTQKQLLGALRQPAFPESGPFPLEQLEGPSKWFRNFLWRAIRELLFKVCSTRRRWRPQREEAEPLGLIKALQKQAGGSQVDKGSWKEQENKRSWERALDWGFLGGYFWGEALFWFWRQNKIFPCRTVKHNETKLFGFALFILT